MGCSSSPRRPRVWDGFMLFGRSSAAPTAARLGLYELARSGWTELAITTRWHASPRPAAARPPARWHRSWRRSATAAALRARGVHTVRIDPCITSRSRWTLKTARAGGRCRPAHAMLAAVDEEQAPGAPPGASARCCPRSGSRVSRRPGQRRAVGGTVAMVLVVAWRPPVFRTAPDQKPSDALERQQ